MNNILLKQESNSYIVATIKDWNLQAYEKFYSIFPGSWTLINEPSQLTIEHLRRIKPRYIFFPHWSWLVPEDILDEFTCVCFHMTDVPYGRGGSPLQNLISRGHKDTKLTALKMTKQLDAGAVYLKAPLSLHGSAQQIFERCAILTFEMINSIITIEPIAIEQTGEVTTFPRRKPEQSEIKGDEKLSELYDLIRMMDADSYPKAFFHHGDFTLTFEQAKLSKSIVNEENTIDAHVIINTSKKAND